MEKYNLHTHSFYCGHGSGTIAEYAAVARKEGLTTLGFSEHCPLPDNRFNRTRMAYDKQASYEADVKQEMGKPGCKILLGYECDYYPEYDAYFRELRERCDYLLAAVHFIQLPDRKDIPIHRTPMDKEMLHAYTDEYITSLQTGLFSVGVHPDLFAIHYLDWDDEAIACSRAILSCAESLDIPLEVNAYGLRKPFIDTPEGRRKAYPILPFWMLAREYRIRVVASADAHTPDALSGFLPLCENFLAPTGLSFCDCPLEVQK